MTLTEPRGDLDRLRARRDAGRLVPHQVRPVSRAIELGGAALYTAAMPRGATPWERHSHGFQGVYLQRSRVVLDAALDVAHLADQLAAHSRDTRRAGKVACRCGEVFDLHSEYDVHQAEALRAWALGDPS